MKNLIPYIFLLICSSANAQGIYKAVDEKGVVFYSSKPAVKGAEPAKLPKIMRGEVKLPASQLVSCKTHGGVDCQAGADSDGSVICSDGFKESAQRFNFSCNAPKLEIADITEVEADGSFAINLRNSKSVIAKKPAVYVRNAEGQQVLLKGPDAIEGFGVGEFRYDPPIDVNGSSKNSKSVAFNEKPGLEKIEVKCDNCP